MNNKLLFQHKGYQIEQELGANRAGGRVTYLARDINTQQPVVIKQFQFVKSEASWSDYNAHCREIQVLRGLKHPGIPRYLKSFETGNGFCMVQEYKPASSLAIPRSFSPDDIQKIAVSLLEILVYLQSRIPPVIHRDLKPANILVDENINVYLVDFGFARVGEGALGMSSVVKGTLGFMPPEQLFNQQITEASDLYGLGITLICLITATKADDVGNLIDISHHANFKHLVPKLNYHWVKWLEKMTEPRLKDRFPNAMAALDAFPSYPIRSPEVHLSETSLALQATTIGKILTHTITVSNPVPETLLTGKWEVAPSISDPPHTPDHHTWISSEPARFTSNRIDCEITIDTSKLMAEKTYSRKLLLHTNALPETYVIELQVTTAPIPIVKRKLPGNFIALLFLSSLVIDWLIASSLLIYGALMDASITPSFSTIAAAAVGLEISAWILATAKATTGATASVIAGFITGMISWVIIWTDAMTPTGTTLGAEATVGLLAGVTLGVIKGFVVEKIINEGFSHSFALGLALLTAASGSCLGLGFMIGFFNPLVLGLVTATSLPLAALLIHLPLRRTQLIANYRKAEHRLIKP